MITSNLQEFYIILPSLLPILSIDYGTKKIGIAISNPEQTIAMPLVLLNTRDEKSKLDEIAKLAISYRVCAIILGMPLNINGDKNSQTEIVEKFAKNLFKICKLPIYLQDERLSSKMADSLLKSMGMNRKERNQKDDLVAASIILEISLDAINKLKHS